MFAGSAPEADGDRVFLEVERMRDSVNYRLTEAGEVHPFFFDTLFVDLREALATATAAVRSTEAGVWSRDKTNIGVEWQGTRSLPDIDPIFPRLWRRLERYTQDRDFRDESDTLAGFIDFLIANPDRLFMISQSRCTDLDNVTGPLHLA